MVYPIGKRIVFPIAKLWIKEINGMENIPKDKPFIIAANHSSYMDHFGMGLLIVPHLNKKLHFLAKKEHFEGMQKIWHKYAGAIPLDREKGGKDALKWAIHALNEGKIIGIYPEGTRSLTGKIQEGKTGIARLAVAAKIPVIPVGLIGMFDIMPKGKIFPRFKRATINVGKPIQFSYDDASDKLLRLMTTKIMKEIAKLSNQTYNY